MDAIAAAADQRRTEGGSDLRILVVEDDPVFSDVLAGALRRRGMDVTLALTCEDAAAAIKAAPPDAAVVDLRIGTGSGLDIIPLLTRGPRPARTVVLTGYGSIATAVEAVKLGASQYLTKPADIDTIIAALTASDADATASPPLSTRPLSVKRVEWEHIQRVLTENHGNISATARSLGIHRRTLQRKLQKHPVRR
ncbi:MAG: response regulator [Gammaproteobacteria bacterium]